MATILDKIIADVRKDTAMRQAHTPLSTLKERIARIAPPLTAVDRLRSVTAQQPAIIAEIKRKSPSKGQMSSIRDPASLAREYEAGGAAAISVLTEERRFGGSLADLDAVRAAVSVPLLRKDFMVEEYQFYEARAHGADIILLIAAALDGDALPRFFELTCSLGMAALVETHTEAEVDRAVALGAELIGVNVRDLKTLATRKEHFSPVGGYIKERTSGWEKKPVIVAESGVFSATDVAVYCSAGADAVLVGEALVKSQDPARAIEEFTAAAGKTCDGQTSSGIQESAAKTMKMNAGGKPSAVHETELFAALQNAPGPYFGDFGGRWMPEAMIAVLDELDEAFKEAKTDPEFKRRLTELNENYSGRPSLLTEAKNFSRYAGNVRIFLKREDLNHTGSHKINNVLGQALLARRLGKKRLIAETGAGQHGVATATAAALFGMECSVYMGTQDTKRQALNVARMQLLGAEVVPVGQGSATLKDAINEALRDWISTTETTHYVLGTAAGPHPFPAMVRFFHETIGEEARAQILEKTGKLPDAVVACVGGGSNAIGIFHAFLDDRNVELYGFEAGGEGVDTGRHAATITAGRPGILHGAKSYILQDDDGQTLESHSISAGLDYPGVGPEHSYLNDIARVCYEPITDAEAMDSFRLLAQSEGILPAIESAHALAGALKVGRHKAKEAVTRGKDPGEIAIVVNLSGRGDKDVDTAGQWFGLLKDADGQAAAS